MKKQLKKHTSKDAPTDKINSDNLTRTKASNSIMHDKSTSSGVWQEKVDKFQQYVDYVKTYPLENHLMAWFDANYKEVFVPDMVEEFMHEMAKKISQLAKRNGVQPIDPSKLAEDPEMYSEE